MDMIEITATGRTRVRKGDNGRLRRVGKIPAVVYGGDKEPRSIVLDEHDFEMTLYGADSSNSVYNLDVEGEGKVPTLVREVQRHPVRNTLVHVDFLRIDLSREADFDITLHVVGADPAGVKEGGILEYVQRTVQVRCTPGNMPQYFEVDLSELGMNESYHAGKLTMPEGVTLLDDPETTLFAVSPPRAEEEPAEGEEGLEGEAAEPEVIGEKKEDEGEEG